MGFPFRRQRGSLLSISPNMGMEVVSDEEKGKGTLTVQGTKLVEKKLIIESNGSGAVGMETYL